MGVVKMCVVSSGGVENLWAGKNIMKLKCQ